MAESKPWSYHPDGSPAYSLADIIRKRAVASPGAIALAEAGRLTSFAGLDRRSSQVARALQAGGPGDRVAFIGATARSSPRSATARPNAGPSSPPSTTGSARARSWASWLTPNRAC